MLLRARSFSLCSLGSCEQGAFGAICSFSSCRQRAFGAVCSFSSCRQGAFVVAFYARADKERWCHVQFRLMQAKSLYWFVKRSGRVIPRNLHSKEPRLSS
ncbi:hypothetical protein ACFX11_038099 [Malus domestica]